MCVWGGVHVNAGAYKVIPWSWSHLTLVSLLWALGTQLGSSA